MNQVKTLYPKQIFIITGVPYKRQANYTKAKKKVCIYVHLLIPKYVLFYEENLSLNDIKSLIDLSSLHLFQLLLKSHDYKVIINA